MPNLDPLDAAITQRVVQQFDRSLARGRSADFVLREVERRMIERLDYIKLVPQRLLDVGIGRSAQSDEPGAAPALLRRYPQARLIGLDGSLPALRGERPAAGGRAGVSLGARFGRFAASVRTRMAGPGSRIALVAGDAHALPLADASADLVWSNAVLHWLADPARAIAELRRVLAPDRLVMLSLFGVDTLAEVRALGVATIPFPDLHDIGDMLGAAGFVQPVVDVEKLVFTYHDTERWLADVRASGVAASALAGALSRRRAPARGAAGPDAAGGSPGRGLHGRAAVGRWRDALTGGRDLRREPLSLTFEVIYAHAWAPPAARVPEGYAQIKLVPRQRAPSAGGRERTRLATL